MVDDLATQLYSNPALQVANLTDTRRALFTLNPRDADKFYDNAATYSLIDKLMEQVPGKDNYAANLTEVLFGSQSYHYTSNQPLNAGYYSRFYQMNNRDAMGRQKRKRGFNDNSLWAARTTQERVSGLKIYSEEDGEVEEKWTWAIPLEACSTPVPLSSLKAL